MIVYQKHIYNHQDIIIHLKADILKFIVIYQDIYPSRDLLKNLPLKFVQV